MLQSPFLQRAMILQQQNRHADAVRELHQHLMQSPRDAVAHAMLAMSLEEMDKLDDAEREAAESIGIAPDLSIGHIAMARVMLKRNRFTSAESSVLEALRIDSATAHYWGLLAAIRADLRRWKDALDAADQGLAFDPSDATCLNVRAMALTHLGDRQAATATMEGALAEDPENAFTHANHGWTLLHRNKPQEAMEHFREALRLDPTLDFAKAGMVEAMKARNPIYRLLLMYFLFVARLGARWGWMIMIGGWVGYQVLRNLARSNPAVAPFVWPVLIAYVVFALSTWLASTMFNLVLWFHPFGKHALSKEQRWTSMLVAGLLAMAVAFGVTFAITREAWPLFGALCSLGLSLPASLLFTCHKGWPRWAMVAILLVLGLLSVVSVVLTAIPEQEERGLRTFQAFAWACLFSQFGAQALAGVRPTR